MKKKTVTIGKSASFLSHTIHNNFISEQPDRFTLFEGKIIKGGQMHFCSTLVDAILYSAWIGGVAILSDDHNEDYVVLTDMKPKTKGAKS